MVRRIVAHRAAAGLPIERVARIVGCFQTGAACSRTWCALSRPTAICDLLSHSRVPSNDADSRVCQSVVAAARHLAGEHRPLHPERVKPRRSPGLGIPGPRCSHHRAARQLRCLSACPREVNRAFIAAPLIRSTPRRDWVLCPRRLCDEPDRRGRGRRSRSRQRPSSARYRTRPRMEMAYHPISGQCPDP